MSITVTPNPTSTPPRFEISVSSSDASTITSITLNRTANGVTVPVRVQPTTGPSPRYVEDVEAPWGTSVVYTATITRSGNTVEGYGGSGTLIPSTAWLIHPTTPSLSVCLDAQNFSQMGILSIGATTRQALTVKHRPIGARYQVVTKTGSRAASTLQLVVAAVTVNEQQALWAVVDDQTPLVIRIPAAWGWDWEDGYYDVGDVSADRVLQYGPEHRRVFTLPLEAVQAPAGNQQSARTWADVLAGSSSWQTLAATYPTWTAVQTNARR